jgi:tetratricopeptide (TPR) repeat protein
MRREDLKEDQFQQFLTKVIKAYYRSPRNFYIGAGAVVAAIVVIVMLLSNKPKPNPQPNIMLDEAVLILQDQQRPDTASAEQMLTELSRRYSSNPMGKRGAFYLGNIYYNQQKYDDARRQFEKFATGVKNDPILSPAAWMGIGNCYEALGTFDKAAEAYATALNRYPKWALADQAALSAGRCFRLKGKYGQAEAVYAKYLKLNPKATTEILNEVKLQLAYVRTLQEQKK